MTNMPDDASAQVHIKREPNDWRVYEQLDFAFTGEGEHAYFLVEKENLNTADVARALARVCKVEVHQVGFAGLKDKHAVTLQWFSVPYRADRWPLDLPGTRCLEVQRHAKKLRRGQHAMNRFEIRLRDVGGLDAARLTLLDLRFANFFGPQRTSAGNIAQALSWLAKGQWGSKPAAAANPQRSRQRKRSDNQGRRGWHLSVLRSMLFNEVLQQRLLLDNYTEQLEGDVVLEGVATGPLWGRGRSATGGAAADIERAALLKHAATCEALEFAGVNQARRKLSEKPLGFAVDTLGGGDYLLRFALPPGAFATVLLAHSLNVVDDSKA